MLQLGSVFRDELLRVRLFNFAGEILIKKKKILRLDLCSEECFKLFFFFPLLVLLVALQELGVQLEH